MDNRPRKKVYTIFSVSRKTKERGTKQMNRFGIRDVCDMVFKPLTSVDLGGQHFDAGQPMLYIDTAKTSSLEGASTTVYATGGSGNPRLVGWDG
ncbi:MAG TPA: hypothetical protein DCW90_11380 [Lachnospiraceae bacterium]|nr:hypothetical protein [Lachnospiraceae bacterium]